MDENNNTENLNSQVDPQGETNNEKGTIDYGFVNNQNETVSQENSNDTSPNSPEQYYQYYEQKMNEQNQIPPQLQPDNGKEKKGIKKVVTAVITIVILLGIGASAFAFQNTIRNTYALMTKSPAAYYSYIEKNELNTITDGLKTMGKKQTNISEHVSADISFNHDKVDSLLKQYAQIGLSDIESNLGIKLSNLGIDVDVSKQDKYIYEKGSLKLNNVDLITTEVFMDSLKKEILYKFPELSPAYLSLTAESDDSSAAASSAIATEFSDTAKLSDFITRYSNIVIDQAKQVSLKKNVKLVNGDNSVKCNKLIITLKNKDMQKITAEVLEEAKNDEYIAKMLPALKITKGQFIDSIDEVIADISKDDTLLKYTSIKMNVYVDSQGNIIGRDLITTEKEKSNKLFSYALFNKKNKCEYTIAFNDETSGTNIEVSGESTENKGVSDGKISLDITSKQLLSLTATINLTYDNVRMVNKNNQMYWYGKYTLSTPLLKGSNITVDYDVDNNIQLCNMVVNLENSPLVTMKSKANYIKDFAFKKPSKSDKIYSLTETDSYFNSIDIKKYVLEVSKKLGIKQELVDSYLSLMQ